MTSRRMLQLECSPSGRNLSVSPAALFIICCLVGWTIAGAVCETRAIRHQCIYALENALVKYVQDYRQLRPAICKWDRLHRVTIKAKFGITCTPDEAEQDESYFHAAKEIYEGMEHGLNPLMINLDSNHLPLDRPEKYSSILTKN